MGNNRTAKILILIAFLLTAACIGYCHRQKPYNYMTAPFPTRDFPTQRKAEDYAAYFRSIGWKTSVVHKGNVWSVVGTR